MAAETFFPKTKP